MRKIFEWVFFVAILTTGCQKLQPEQISIPEYPDLEAFYNHQVASLDKSILEKTVTLEDKLERTSFEMDTSKWKDELSFLIEINPNQPEYLGVFEKTVFENTTSLILLPNEKGILKDLTFKEIEGEYLTVSATIHEDKDVYIHHRDITISLNNGLISTFEISGYQKMILRDTVRFSINGTILSKTN